MGVDVGFSRTKAVASNGKEVDFISQTALFRKVKYDPNIAGIPYHQRMVINLESEKFFVGESAGKQALANATVEKRRTVDREGKLLLLGAMGNLIDHSPERVNLVVGLPVSNMDLKSDYMQMAGGRQKFTFLTPDGSHYKDVVIDVEETRVMPQPFGSLFDLILNNYGALANATVASGEVGVIDIGYGTTDFLRCIDLDPRDALSTSENGIGGHLIAKELSDLIYAKYGERIPIEDMDPIVRTGRMHLNGESLSVKDLLTDAKKVSAEAILSRAVSLWPDLRRLKLIVITGGAAFLIGEYLAARLGKVAVVAKNPVFSNRDGYLKYAWRVWGR